MERKMKEEPGSKSTTGTGKLNLALIASGSGTDANSIMEAWEGGGIPEINPPSLISTKKGAGCLEKAERRALHGQVLDYKECGDLGRFNLRFDRIVKAAHTDLIFLVGCIIKIYPIEGIEIYNIHPADPARHGGDKMYGLAVHQHVLEETKDLIYRGKKKLEDKFYTYPTVHEVNSDFDGGDLLLRQAVLIPSSIVGDYCAGLKDPKEVAKDLQEVVLPYEWLMLPAAVRMAARRILEKRNV